jgi:hypothetical protein
MKMINLIDRMETDAIGALKREKEQIRKGCFAIPPPPPVKLGIA